MGDREDRPQHFQIKTVIFCSGSLLSSATPTLGQWNLTEPTQPTQASNFENLPPLIQPHRVSWGPLVVVGIEVGSEWRP